MSKEYPLQAQIEDIARRRLGFETLKARGRDHLDFKEVNCVTLAQALHEAYQLGLIGGGV